MDGLDGGDAYATFAAAGLREYLTNAQGEDVVAGILTINRDVAHPPWLPAPI